MISRHEVIIYCSVDNGAFLTEVPELPGCMTNERTHKDALRAVERIAKEWIDTARGLGRDIPEPHGRQKYA